MIRIHTGNEDAHLLTMSARTLCDVHCGEAFIGECSMCQGSIFLISYDGVISLNNPKHTWPKNWPSSFRVNRFVDLEINVKEKGE